MVTEYEVENYFYGKIKKCVLAYKVNGELCYKRKPTSTKEDIVISCLSIYGSQMQEAIVNVNVYVKGIKERGYLEEDRPRIKELAKCSLDELMSIMGDGYKVEKIGSSQKVIEITENGEHCINNRLLVRISNL